DGRYLFVNRTWERTIGLKRDSVIGTSLRDTNDPAAGATLALDREALARGPDAPIAPREYDYNGRRYMQTRTVMVDSEDQRSGEQEPGEPMSYRLRRRDGRYIWIHAEGVSQVDDDGRTRRFITSYLDVTAFREQEEALKENVRLREEVERIGRHDLKTPLASIVAVPRLLRESGNLTADQSELLTLVERAGYRVLNMVNLSLDLLKMEQGSYRFRPQPLNVARLLHKVNGDIRNHAASKQVAVQVFVDGMPAAAAPPVFAWAEETLCYSILANLL